MSADLPQEFPPRLWADICAAEPEDTATCQYLAKQTVYWADGRHPDELGQVLDAMRAAQAYGVSLELLEAAWNSSAPESFRAQIAQDWVGTVLFGIGDADGAVTVAEHITKTAQAMGSAFLSDFADLLMEWGLLPAAFPILKEAVKRLPGDLTIKYNLGTCYKFRGEWTEAKRAFMAVDQHQSAQLHVLHNLLLCAIATKDQALVESTRQRIENASPDTAWHLSMLVQVELAADDDHAAEVLFAMRVAPHVVRLRSIPNRLEALEYDDLLLVDYQAQRYAEDTTSDNATHIFPILARLERGAYRTEKFVAASPQAAKTIAERLDAHQVPARVDGQTKAVLIAVSSDNRTVVTDLLQRLGD